MFRPQRDKARSPADGGSPVAARQDPVGATPGPRRRPAPRPPNQGSPSQIIGRFFRATREAQDLSQEQLAALTRGTAARVSRAMISAIERGVHLPGLDVLLTLSQALHVSPNEVLERLELARCASVDAEGLTFEEADRLAGRCFWAGDHRRAVAYYDAALRLTEASPLADPDEQRRRVAVTEIRRGTALRRCGATTASRAAVERAIALGDDVPEIQAQGYVVLAALLVQLGCLPLARDAAERAVELSQGCTPQIQGWAWIEKGEVLAAAGRWVEARQAFLHARKRVREAGDRHHRIHVEGNIGACLHGLKRFQQARARYLKAIELARRFEVSASEALWLLELGRLSFDEGRMEQADGYARESLRISAAAGQHLTCFRAEWLRHRVSRALDPDDADRHRVAHLKKLFTRLEQHRGVDEIREFKAAYGSRATGREGSS